MEIDRDCTAKIIGKNQEFVIGTTTPTVIGREEINSNNLSEEIKGNISNLG